MGKKINLIDRTFGRLTVVSELEKRSGSYVVWKCLCSCGNYANVVGAYLRDGHTKSCGCLWHDIVRLPKGEAAFNKLYRKYKHDAERSGRVFKLTKEEFEEIVTGNCHYCGDSPTQTIKSSSNGFFGDFTYNGIDRVDNKIGYTVENVVTCCSKCNYAKGIITQGDFAEMVIKVYNNFAAKTIDIHELKVVSCG